MGASAEWWPSGLIRRAPRANTEPRISRSESLAIPPSLTVGHPVINSSGEHVRA